MQNAKDELFTKIYHEFKDALYGFVFKRVADDAAAEELLGDIFISAYQNFDQQRVRYASWLYVIAKNKIIDYYRKQRDQSIQNNILDTFIDVNQENVIQEIDYLLFRDYFDANTEMLTGFQKESIKLFYFESLSSQEISHRLKISDVSVRKHLSRGLQKIRETWSLVND
jgi:RNA polymerase sigma-70 factor (ECF subfamily)